MTAGFDPRAQNAERDFRFADGLYENREQRFRAQLVESVTVSGDLDGDGVADAVVLVVVNSGGSGSFAYAVAMLDRSGRPVQRAYEFLGDRVRVDSFVIANRRITVDMIAHGPKDPLCCPTERVVKTLGIQVPLPGG